MHKLLSITKQTSNKFLNLFVATYQLPNGQLRYQLASRKQENNLTLLQPNAPIQPDAVRMLPYFTQNAETHVVLIKEFRHALNRYIYSTPAGLIDAGETIEEAARRELSEEIGATTLSCKQTDAAMFTSAGLTDEAVVLLNCELQLSSTPQLENTEDIELAVVPLNNLLNFLNTHEFCLQSKLQLKVFLLESLQKE